MSREKIDANIKQQKNIVDDKFESAQQRFLHVDARNEQIYGFSILIVTGILSAILFNRDFAVLELFFVLITPLFVFSGYYRLKGVMLHRQNLYNLTDKYTILKSMLLNASYQNMNEKEYNDFCQKYNIEDNKNQEITINSHNVAKKHIVKSSNFCKIGILIFGVILIIELFLQCLKVAISVSEIGVCSYFEINWMFFICE